MSYVNTFIVLSKDERKVHKICNFFKYIEGRSENNKHNEIRLDRLDIGKYSGWHAVEGDLRNTYGSNIRYWVKKLGDYELFKDCYFIVSYESQDCIQLESMVDDTREMLMDNFGDLTPLGEKLSDTLPLDDVEQYFSDNL